MVTISNVKSLVILMPLLGALTILFGTNYTTKQFIIQPDIENELIRQLPPRPHHHDYYCHDDDTSPSYFTCNGFSNQLLGHVGYIATLIKSARSDIPIIRIPDAFITNGVQTEEDGKGTLLNVFANKNNSIPLSTIIDVEGLLSKIEQYGAKACLVQHEQVITQLHQNNECSWLSALSEGSNEIELELMDSLRPSLSVSAVLDSTFVKLENILMSANLNLSNGICLHHRDGPDWHNHCRIWNGNNCLNSEGQSIEKLVRHRVPRAYPKKWVYYVGDEDPSPSLVSAFKETNNQTIVHRSIYDILQPGELQKFLRKGEPSIAHHRDLFAVVDFFLCDRIDSFIGNSVSTFSAFQIAKRHGKDCSWYNSRSIPLLAGFLQVLQIPIVYTYSEESNAQSLLKASILSARRVFGMHQADIHVIYHDGFSDTNLLNWLESHNVILHKHEITWLGMIDKMLSYTNSNHSQSQSANRSIGIWQRIDIPHFINAEYCLFLDSNTILHEKFNLADFGLDITPGLALSSELYEEQRQPINAGVALINIPKLRETYGDFLDFIQRKSRDHVEFTMGSGIQGAYLDFYHSYSKSNQEINVDKIDYSPSKYVQFLDASFNVKPYWTSGRIIRNRKVIHFHGLEPQQIMKGWMGYGSKDFHTSVQFLLPVLFGRDDIAFACDCLREFGISLVADKENLRSFCSASFPKANERDACLKFFLRISETTNQCQQVMKSLGFSKNLSFVLPTAKCPEGEKMYLEMYDDVANAVERGQFQSGFEHWEHHGKKEFRMYTCAPKQVLNGTHLV